MIFVEVMAQVTSFDKFYTHGKTYQNWFVMRTILTVNTNRKN